MPEQIATFCKQIDLPNKIHRLYRVDPPMRYAAGDDEMTTEFVIVSAAQTLMGPATYMFPSDADGNVQHWGELTGSFRGALNPDRALINAGYWPVDPHAEWVDSLIAEEWIRLLQTIVDKALNYGVAPTAQAKAELASALGVDIDG